MADNNDTGCAIVTTIFLIAVTMFIIWKMS